MNTDFDTSLKQIPHYQAYPAMLPFVGEEYISEQHKKVLVIGESHYLPKESTVHHDAEAWYAGSQESLNDKEVAWINTCELILSLHEEKKNVFRVRLTRKLRGQALAKANREFNTLHL